MSKIKELKKDNTLPSWLKVEEDKGTGQPYFQWVNGQSENWGGWQRFAPYVESICNAAKLPLTKEDKPFPQSGVYPYPENKDVIIRVYLEQNYTSGVWRRKIEARGQVRGGEGAKPEDINNALHAFFRGELKPDEIYDSGTPLIVN